MSIDFHAILQHAGALQRVMTLRELVEVTSRAVQTQTRYRHAWFCLFEPDGANARVVEFAGSLAMHELVFAKCPRVPVAGDAMMAAIMSGRAPVVVEDARTDPRTNKAIVGQLGNRTIVNIPLALGSELFGSLGIGTYGDEGVRPPTPAELEWLTMLGLQLAAAYSRLLVLERQQEDARARQGLERHLEALQRVELMGVLASGVAHDLNNYLTVIQSGIELLGLGAQSEVLDDLQQATTRAREVTRQLLTLGRAQAPRREEVDLQKHVESTVQLVRSSMPRGVALTVEASPAPVVRGDPVQIDQVLANLLINARDAVGPSGTIRVGVDEQVLGTDFVRAHTWARPGRYGRVWVRDDGCGISPEHLAHIFDPLFSTKSRGTGLGLAVVSRVVQQHEGLVHCESALGEGTTFDVYLPVTPPSSPAR